MKGSLRLAACRTLLCLLAVLFLVATNTASGQVNGTIFTTFSDGASVNGNIFPAKDKVYISGGPQNEHPRGLSPDGVYYFQVTDPSGAVLLSTDDVTCRQVVVSGGRIVGVPAAAAPASCTEPAGSATPGAFHNLGAADPNSGQTPVQLCAPSGCPAGSPDFKDTPDTGGEYKVWITLVADFGEACKKGHSSFGFCDSDSKTDNFKVKKPAMATVTVCKFNDQDDSGFQDAGEPLIPHWPVTATGVVGDSGNGFSTQTDDSGCVSFSVSSFTNGGATVTFQEGTLGPDWTRTAPIDGACTLTGSTVNSADTCSVSSGVLTLNVSPGDDVSAPNFGNFNPNCTAGCTGQQLLVTKTAHPVVTYAWKIQKSVDNNTINTSGSATANYTVTVSDNGTATMTGNIRVSNPFGPDLGGITVTDVVSDVTADGGDCTVTTPSDVTATDGTITVEAGTHVDATYSCTFTNVPAAGTNTNTATATWANGTAIGNASFDFSQATIVDGSVSVTDTLQGSLGSVSIDGSGNATTTPNSPVTSSATGIFNYSLTFNDPAGTCTTHNNTATFTTSTTTTTGSDSKSVKVCVGADLAVTKSAVATFNSSIVKNVDKTLVEQAGGTITFTYTIAVTESGWSVAGNINVTNPNDWEAITANVGDALGIAGGVCTITGGGSVTVGASSSVSLPYVCTFSSAPAASGINTANVSWDKGAFFTPAASSSGSAGFAFSALTVTDAFNSGPPFTLGTISAPAASTTFTDVHTVNNAVGGTCQSFTNTATLLPTNQTSSRTVTVCNAATGALTIGFWQNKNGQALITGGAATAGVCNSATFLRTFNPFQDLSATATCSQVAAYVSNIIKAANASGAAMNAMLKAQMLATALDVFFSDPTLGGNLIGAATPLGAVKIDLTQVGEMIDSFTGSLCSCNRYDVSALSFGGSQSLTVAAMLSFAASQSNGDGSVWYGQNKTVQQGAKDAFDEINNQVAFIAP